MFGVLVECCILHIKLVFGVSFDSSRLIHRTIVQCAKVQLSTYTEHSFISINTSTRLYYSESIVFYVHKYYALDFYSRVHSFIAHNTLFWTYKSKA